MTTLAIIIGLFLFWIICNLTPDRIKHPEKYQKKKKP